MARIPSLADTIRTFKVNQKNSQQVVNDTIARLKAQIGRNVPTFTPQTKTTVSATPVNKISLSKTIITQNAQPLIPQSQSKALALVPNPVNSTISSNALLKKKIGHQGISLPLSATNINLGLGTLIGTSQLIGSLTVDTNFANLGGITIGSSQLFGNLSSQTVAISALIPNMTSNVTPSGIAFSQPTTVSGESNTFVSPASAAFAYLGDMQYNQPVPGAGTNLGWSWQDVDTLNGILRYQFPTPQIAYFAVAFAAQGVDSSSPAILQGSNDAINWVTLASLDMTLSTPTGLTNTTAYLYYQITFTNLTFFIDDLVFQLFGPLT